MRFCVERVGIASGAEEHGIGHVAVLFQVLFFACGETRGMKNSGEGNIEPVNPLTPSTTTTQRPPRKNSELSIISCRGINMAVFCFLVKYFYIAL